jgi:hypothetical protein
MPSLHLGINMKQTLKEIEQDIFYSWFKGEFSFYKLGLIHGIHNEEIKRLCVKYIPEPFKSQDIWKRNAYKNFRKVMNMSFPTLESYLYFYKNMERRVR